MVKLGVQALLMVTLRNKIFIFIKTTIFLDQQ